MTSNAEEIEGWQNPQLIQPVRPSAKKKDNANRKANNIRPSRLTESRAYDRWLDDKWRKHNNIDVDPHAIAKNNAKNRLKARSDRIRLFKQHLKANDTNNNNDKDNGRNVSNNGKLPSSLLSQYYYYKNTNNNNFGSKEDKDGGIPGDMSLYDNSIMSLEQQQQAQYGDQNTVNFNLDILSTKDLENHTWLKPDHINAFEKYAIKSPRKLSDNVDTKNINLEKDIIINRNKSDNINADHYMERIKFAKRLEREPDSIEFTKFKNSILSMSKQVTSTYKNALGSIQSNQNREINNLKVKHQAELDQLTQKYEDQINYYIRRTEHLKNAEAAVRELVEINKRLSRGGQGSTLVPAHIFEKINIWDRKNYENTKTAQSSYDKYVAKTIKKEVQVKNETNVGRVKPWTPTQNVKRASKHRRGRNDSKSYIADLLEKIRSDRREWESKQAEWIENEQSQRTMLQSLRRDNQDLRYESEKLQNVISRLKDQMTQNEEKNNVTIKDKDAEIETLKLRYVTLEGKYKVCHKELKAYEMDNFGRRRKESFDKAIEADRWN